jgi:2-C-methyl-D-erythritol 4-phosphate cytidylyltransferase
MKKIAIIVAGGSGSRMNSPTPKQFLLLNNKPILFYSIQTFIDTFFDFKIILVLPNEHVEKGKEIINHYFSNIDIAITTGGATRFHSVKNALEMIHEESIIFVHDAVRCLITPQLVKNLYESVLTNGAVIPVVSATDSIRITNPNGSTAVNRETVKIVQTPQVFFSSILMPAYAVSYHDQFTDDASVVENAGHSVFLVEGEATNIKITHPADLIVAEGILNKI